MHAWVDATAGIAGDMLVAALIDAGAPVGRLAAAVDNVIPGAVELAATEVSRAGIRAIKFDVRREAGSSHGELPVPVPAVLELASGWRVLSGGDGELATPTGVALLTALCEE